jgi:hypothetical protein
MEQKHLSDSTHYIIQAILCSGINFVDIISEKVRKSPGGQILLNW